MLKIPSHTPRYLRGPIFLRDKWRTIRLHMATFTDWHKTVFPFNRRYRGLQTLHLRAGGEVTLNDIFSSELSFVTSFFHNDEYKLDEIRLPENAVVFDLGANIGLFSIDIHRRYPDARITAYEPHPDTFALLQKNAPFARLYQRAAAGTTGTVEIERGGKAIDRRLVTSGGIKVPAQNLDDILADALRVDLLKVDIEGSEYGLFESASPAAIAKIRGALIELHAEPSGSKNAWLEEFFTARGFSVRWIYDWGVAYVWRQ